METLTCADGTVRVLSRSPYAGSRDLVGNSGQMSNYPRSLATLADFDALHRDDPRTRATVRRNLCAQRLARREDLPVHETEALAFANAQARESNIEERRLLRQSKAKRN